MSVETFVATRYRCPHCRRSWSKKATATEHETRCWKNPAARGCLTCRHHTPYRMDDCGGRPGCRCADTPESCDLDLMPVAEDGTLFVVSGCRGWAS